MRVALAVSLPLVLGTMRDDRRSAGISVLKAEVAISLAKMIGRRLESPAKAERRDRFASATGQTAARGVIEIGIDAIEDREADGAWTFSRFPC